MGAFEIDDWSKGLTKRAIVIGGGIAGLASAALLGKSGMQVDLYESRDSLGGRAYLWEKEGFRFDMGPSWYLMPDAFEQFFKLMGTTAKDQLNLVRLDPAYQTRNEGLGDKIPMPMDLPGIRRMFDEIEPVLERISIVTCKARRRLMSCR